MKNVPEFYLVNKFDNKRGIFVVVAVVLFNHYQRAVSGFGETGLTRKYIC